MSTPLRQQIRESSATRESLERLAAVLPADDTELDVLIGELIAENAIFDFANLVYAALGANRPVEAKHLVKGTYVLVEAGNLTDISLRLQGDVARYLLEALDNYPFEPRDKAVILIAAAVWSRDRAHADFPPDLYPKIRELVRMKELPKGVLGLLISLAVYTKDEALLELLRTQHLPTVGEKKWQATRELAHSLAKDLAKHGKEPLFDLLPETRDHWISYDSTVRRAVKQVGRNEPCPCGSGKKYKHCCLEKDRQRLRDSTDIAGVTQQEIDAAPESILTLARLDAADIYDMQKFDPLKVPPPLLARYFHRLTEFRLYGHFAESFEKIGYSEPLDAAWNEALHFAAKAGRKDIAQRLIDVRKGEGFTVDQLSLGSQFLMIEDDPEKCLAFIEDTTRKALQSGDLNPLIGLAYSLSVSKYRGLGILLTRSVVPLVDEAMASSLMGHLLRARDALNLPPEEAISDVLDTLWAGTGQDVHESEAYREVQERFEAKRRESRELREELERRKKEARRLESIAAQPSAAPLAMAQPRADKSREERIISHLEEEVKTSNEALNVLRRELHEMKIKNEEPEQKPAEPEIDPEDELVMEAEAQGAQPVRIIDFSRDFQQKLNHAPRDVARRTMAMLGRLASGESAAFVGAVRLKACPSVMRHRMGIDWRLLFRLLPDRVEAVDLIPRQDLERRIKTLVTQYT